MPTYIHVPTYTFSLALALSYTSHATAHAGSREGGREEGQEGRENGKGDEVSGYQRCEVLGINNIRIVG